MSHAPAVRVRFALACAASLLVLGFVLSPGKAQPGRGGGGFGRPAGMPGVGAPPLNPGGVRPVAPNPLGAGQPTPPPVPTFRTVWRCSRCTATLSGGGLASCPSCGASFSNGGISSSQEPLESGSVFGRALLVVVGLGVVVAVIGLVSRNASRSKAPAPPRKRRARTDEDDDSEEPRRRSDDNGWDAARRGMD